MSNSEWTNWAGTQSCRPAQYVRAGSVDQICETVAEAADRGLTVRPVGSGHSFTPVVSCDGGVILDIGDLSGIQDVDVERNRARIWAGSKLSTLGEPLWNAGLSFKNQGDIDSQTLAGALNTATHGSGLQYTSFSGVLTRAEMVTATGDVVVVTESDSDLLAAVQTGVGSLGVLVNAEIQLMSAYQLVEEIEYWPLAKVLERWEHETRNSRHFQFWWGPYPGSLELYGMPPAPTDVEDPCYVRRYTQIPAETIGVTSPTGRVDRAYRIYADDYPPGWDEFEYFVPFDRSIEALEVIRPVLDQYPAQRYPVEVRAIGAETALLSPMHGRDSVSISVSGAVGTDYRGFLEAMDAALRPFGARPHWGKTHFCDASRLREVYPRYDDFVAIRRKLDPGGVFLNDHLTGMLA